MAKNWQVKSIFHINLNCSDLDRSVEFYERLGFVKVMDSGQFIGETDESYEAMGLVAGSISHRGPIVLFLGDNPRQTRLDLMQWDIPEPAPTHRLRPYDVGVPRLCLWVKNLEDLHAELSRNGIEFLSLPRGPFEDRAIKSIVCLRDPDGLLVEMLEFLPGGRSLYNQPEGVD